MGEFYLVLIQDTTPTPRGQSLATVLLGTEVSNKSAKQQSWPDLLPGGESKRRRKEHQLSQRGRMDAKVIPQHVLTLNITAYYFPYVLQLSVFAEAHKEAVERLFVFVLSDY